MTLDAWLADLKAKAAAATPGPYRLQVTDFCGADGVTIKIGGSCQGAWDDDDHDPTFIAACCPQVVSALVDVAKAAKKVSLEIHPTFSVVTDDMELAFALDRLDKVAETAGGAT